MKTVTKSILSFNKSVTDFGSKNKGVLKCLFMVCLVLFMSSANIFAADATIAVLDNAGESILSLITAKWVRALLTVALVIEFGICAFFYLKGEDYLFVVCFVLFMSSLFMSSASASFFLTEKWGIAFLIVALVIEFGIWLSFYLKEGGYQSYDEMEDNNFDMDY